MVHFEDELKARQHTMLDLVNIAHRLGADGIELRREPWPGQAEELAAVRRQAEALGLLIIYATMATLFNDNPAGEQALYEDIATAKALGAPQLRVFQGPAPDDLTDPAWEKARQAIDEAAGHGLVLALENYARTPGGTLAEIKRVLDEIQSPSLTTNIDFANYYGRDEDIFNAIQTVGSRASSAHLKDVADDSDDRLTYLGGGQLPMDRIMDALDALPQKILYCFEFRGGGDPEGRIEKSIAYLQARA
jgi:sugar phosphate isomerase/epimerase